MERLLSGFSIGPDPRGLSLLADGSLMTPRWRSSPDGGTIYRSIANDVHEISLELDTFGDSDNTTGGVPNLLEHVMPTIDGRTLFIPMLHANVLRGDSSFG